MNAFNLVHCLGANSCRDIGVSTETGRISSNNTVQCGGAYGCGYSNIINTPVLECLGQQSCEGANISGIGSVYGLGWYALHNAMISSENIDFGNLGELTIEFYGENSGFGARVICKNENDTCYIKCHGNGCLGVNMEGEGTFIVDCDSSCGISCPNNYIEPLNLDCYDEYECFGQNIDAMDDAINCGSAFSCASTDNTQNSAVLTSSQSIACNGWFSCQYSTLMGSKYAECEGPYACKDSILRSNDYISCSSESSCYGASISDGINIAGNGHDSLYSANIENVGTVAGSGLLALSYATVIWNSGVGNRIILDGDRSGYYLTITCDGIGTSCKIECSGDACEYTTLNCINGAICEIECDNECNLCPIGWNEPTPLPTPMPTYFKCPNYCSNGKNGICPCDENEHCADNKCFDWGCQECEFGYFYPGFDSPCVSCQDTFGSDCNSCVNWSGCNSCKNGKILTWDEECHVNYCK
jgi:hypothetical protein